MKRFSVFLLALCLLLGCVGCTDGEKTTNGQQGADATQLSTQPSTQGGCPSRKM